MLPRLPFTITRFLKLLAPEDVAGSPTKYSLQPTFACLAQVALPV